MRSARSIFILSETLMFVTIVVLVLFVMNLLQRDLKKDHLELQKKDISRVDLLISSFINSKYVAFRDFKSVRDRKDASLLMSGYSDIYYIDRSLRVTSIIKKERGSSVFKGYDFSASGAGLFFRKIHSGSPSVSRMFRSPESDSLSIYIAASDGERIIAARVDMVNLAKDINRIAEFHNNILLLTSPDGYILSSSMPDLPLSKLPDDDVHTLSLDKEYLLTKGISESIECGIAVLTPVSFIYRIIDSIRPFIMLFIAVLLFLMGMKIFAELKILVVPIEKFTKLVSIWDFERGGLPVSGFVMKIREAKILYDTFYDKTVQVKKGISELKIKENEMQEMRNYLKSIIDSMPSIIISTDSQDVITEWNAAAARFTRIPEEEAIGGSLFQVFPQLSVIEKNYRETIRSGFGFEISRGIEVNDSVTDMNISVFPLSAANKGGVVIRLDDITLFENAEASLRQAQKMEVIGTLAGGLAHDFNNILAGVQGSVSILKLKTENSADLNQLRPVYNKYLGFLEQSVERSADIISKLLTLSRKNETVFRKVDLNEIINVIREICASSFDKSVELSVSPYPGEAYVRGDGTQLEQVFLNLCVNGAHAMTIMREAGELKGGVLSLSAARIVPDQYFLKTHPESSSDCEYWKVSVKDTGVGMSREILAGMYDPFFTTKGKKGGTGLGLTMAYNIIQQHSGFIDVYTEKGIGSEFIVYLPVLTDETDISGAEVPGTVRKGEGTILVIDDEEVIRVIASELLTTCGFRVIPAPDGRKGIDIFREKQGEIKLVLLDIIMPGMTGIETYRELKEINGDVKVLLTSGFRNEEKIQEAMDLGVDGFIQKPFNLARLSEAVFKIIGRLQ